MAVLGIDIGGSGVRGARVEGAVPAGAVVRRALADRGIEAVLDAVAEVVAGLGGATADDRVGIGVPGFVRCGVVLASPNFPTWHDVDLRNALADRLGAPVVVENDANAATLGARERLATDADLVLLTLGTGVGGGVVSEGRLLRGRAGTAAELGHVFVGGDRDCNCGGVGCLEQWCSTTGLVRSARDVGKGAHDGEAVMQAARAGEAWAVQIVQEAGRRLGIGLVTLVNAFAPQVVAIAGGLSLAEDLLGAPALAWLHRHGIRANVAQLDVHWLGPADELAIIGSAVAARDGA